MQPQLPRVPTSSGLCVGESSQKSPYRHCGEQGQEKEIECLTSSHDWRGDTFSFDIFIIKKEICTESDFFLLFCYSVFFYPDEFIAPSRLGKDIGRGSWEVGDRVVRSEGATGQQP